MIRLTNALGITLSFFLFVNCSHRTFESYYSKELSNDTTLIELINVVEDFESYLLKHSFIEKIDKQNYKDLMNKALKDEIILQADSNFYNEVNAQVFIENFSFPLSCFMTAFERWEIKDDSLSSAYKLAQIQREINEKGDIGDSLLNAKLIESINDVDINKTIYRVPIVYIIFEILEKNYSNYYEWKTVDNIYFKENSAEIDFNKSNLHSLDSVCSIINLDNYTFYEFLALGIDNEKDKVDYNLTVERTNYFVNYLFEKKGLNQSNFGQYRIPKNYNFFMTETFTELFQKRKAQVVYKERYYSK